MGYSRVIDLVVPSNRSNKRESGVSSTQPASCRPSKRESSVTSTRPASYRSSKRESCLSSTQLTSPAMRKSILKRDVPDVQNAQPTQPLQQNREQKLPPISSQRGGNPQIQHHGETSSLSSKNRVSRGTVSLPHIRSRRLSIRESTILKAPPFILMSDDEKSIESQWYRSSPIMKRNPLVRFCKRQEYFQQLSERVHRSFDLDFEIVKKVVAYAKSLPISGTNIIDRNIFDAQMSRHFNLTNKKYLPQMYRVCCLDPKQEGKVHVAEYAELICIFLSRNFDLKIQFVFKVYNWRNDGILNLRDLDYYISCITDGYIYNDDEDIFDLKQWLLKLLTKHDTNNDMDIDLDEYREIVNREPLMLQMLGPCMPDQHKIVNFRTLLEDRSVMECSALFRFERQISLCAPDKHFMTGDIQKYYSVPLDLI